jgi:catechol 2,3-dioxygenase-like lactoylglutathione lyase family enzyme
MRIEAVRVARQTDRLADVAAFYCDVIGLPVIGGFEDHDGYDGVMLGLPGEAVHLEFTTRDVGSPGEPGAADDLLVLYVDASTIDRVADRAAAAGIPIQAADNPYWTRVGAVLLRDPDGRRLVIAPVLPTA